MKTPTIEEVKFYFRNAEKIECRVLYQFHKPDLNTIYFNGYSYYCTRLDKSNNMLIWDKRRGYSSIIFSKQETYEIF